MIVGCLGGILLNSFSFYLLEDEIKKLNTIKHYELKEQKSLAETKHYNIIAKKYEQIKINQHDMNRHLALIRYYIEHNNKEEAIAYMENLSKRQMYDLINPITGNKILDVILDEKIQVARQNGIDINIKIKDTNLSNLSDVDITTIFSNVLDNAIESCENCRDKYINVKIYTLNENRIAISVKNSCEVFSNISNDGMLITLKGDKDKHGYGLKSVEKAATKYGGEVKFLKDETNNTFSTFITILN